MENFIAARAFQQPISVPRMQVIRRKLGSDTYHNNTKWSFTTAMLEHSFFGDVTDHPTGQYDNFRIMELKERFEGYVQMAEYNLLRLHILIWNTEEKQEQNPKAKMLIELMRRYFREFLHKSGPFDRIRENVQRKGLLQLVMQLITEPGKWIVSGLEAELWESIYLLICGATIIELREKVINDINRASCQLLSLSDVYECITHTFQKLQLETNIVTETMHRAEMSEITYDRVPSNGRRYYVYFIFAAEFELKYHRNEEKENEYDIEVIMNRMVDTKLKEIHFQMLKNPEMNYNTCIPIDGEMAIKPNPISKKNDAKLPPLDFLKIKE